MKWKFWNNKKLAEFNKNKPIRYGDHVKIKVGFYTGIIAKVYACNKSKNEKEEAKRVCIYWHLNGNHGCDCFDVTDLELTNEPLSK